MDNYMPVLIVSSVLLWLMVLINFLLTIAIVSRGVGIKNDGLNWLKIGSKAPDFNEINLDNEILTLDSFNGSSLLLVFIAPNCRSCSSLMPQIPELAELLKNNHDTEMVLVSIVGQKSTLEFIAEYGLTMSVIVAPRNSSALIDNYKVGATPFFCLVDKNKRVEDTGYFSPKWDSAKSRWLFNVNKKYD